MRFQAKLQPVGQQFLAAIQAIDLTKAQELHEQWRSKREKAQLDRSDGAAAD